MIRRYMGVVAWTAASLGLAAGLSACGGATASATDEVEFVRSVTVRVTTVRPEPFLELVRLVGVVQANRDLVVAAEESGVVRSLYVEKGARVSAGQPLLKIDDALLTAQHEQAMADARLARETYERQRRLWEDEQVGSELAFLRAKYAAEAAEAQVKVLATRLERTTVRSPIAGVFDARLAELGAMVSPGTPVARVVDVATVKVLAGVPERYAGDIGPGAEAFVTLDAMPGREFTGRLEFVGTAVDDASRTFPVEVQLTNAGAVLKPGLVANVGITRRALESALVIPQEAVVRAENGFIVYVAVRQGEDWVSQARPVRTGASLGGRVVIESGLEQGDQVVVVGQQQLAGGDILRIAGNDRP
jgi:membrane fusion protein (multidrug efflux system)